ncbi:MAG: hypothetical protein QM754_09720 [Tepidisphaeraceae bacterium]
MTATPDPASATETWRHALRGVAVIALPIANSLLALVIAGKCAADEPYGVFDWADAALQVGGPIVLVLSWLIWFALFLTKPGRRWRIALPMVLWACLTSYFACRYAINYFWEPWAWDRWPGK